MGPNMAATVVPPDDWTRMWRAADNSSVIAACAENYGPHGRREPILDAFKQLSDAFGELASEEALDLNMANTIAGLLDDHREFLLVSHDPLLQKVEHYLPGLQQEVRLCLIGRCEYWKGRALEHGFVADAQALQKSVTCKSPTDEIFAAGGNSPEGIRRLIEGGGEGLSPAVQGAFRAAKGAPAAAESPNRNSMDRPELIMNERAGAQTSSPLHTDPEQQRPQQTWSAIKLKFLSEHRVQIFRDGKAAEA